MSNQPLYLVDGLKKYYATNQGGFIGSLLGSGDELKAVDDVQLTIDRGEIVGLAGQSGCGKSTLGELLLSLQQPTGGQIRFDGEDITSFDKSQRKSFRQQAQIIFQDPYEALNPRFPVSRLVSEPLSIHDIGNPEERNERTYQALDDAGLSPPEKYLDKLPRELSGGERQRVCIARALVLDPEFIVADEPVSMLDVSVRASILHLFKELREKRDLTMLYISHNLSTINYLTDRTMIMYLGNIVERGETQKVIHDSAHPYSEMLVSAVPDSGNRSLERTSGEAPDPVNLPDGCRFHPYCQYATDECRTEEPKLESMTDGREVACYHPVNN